ncbi:uncharacterized protein LOC110453936 [Mizuhopecten yessoensis]|uniref:Protein Dok-7 n=1 Tax=Mizuhopecten yessoensis TaxID=6573 RepID=A0A210QG89_MIZYE|nr:uncharacterized protein LOC110453936 [Mizuhopecten yessoensis]OWF47777.1 Protein Dok-7 [Mizuhopecten yessoensis]
MADVNSVVEENVKFRDGKKWKARWCVLKKPSPVADRMQVLLFKCVKDALKGENAKHDFYLEDFYGLETGFSQDKENNVLAIVCQKQITTFAFENRETLIKFEVKIRTAIGEENQFPLHVHLKRVPPQSKLPLEKMRMHIHGPKFCLTQHSPPKMLASWVISDLRKFGKLEGKFVFEGGSRCGKGAGVHVLQSDQVDDLEEIFQLASQGKTVSGRKSNKRRSQNCDYLDPVTKSLSGNLYKNSVPSSPNSYDSRGWRHSFSTSNSGWTNNSNFGYAANYNFNSQLRSIENLEREKLMALYDVPPRHIRKVENPKSPKHEHEDSLQHSPHMCDDGHNLDHSSSSLSLASCESSPTYLGCKASVSASAPALCGYGAYSPFNDKYKSISCSVPNHIDELEELDREEALECLQREERGLQQEISLLDEMLQGCQYDDPRRGRNRRDRNKPPPVPGKIYKSSRRPENVPTTFNHGAFYQGPTLLSPNLVSKLKRIPSNSKLSAPLPYVNLEKYDIGDVDNSHVHVSSSCADSGTWSAPCVPSGKKHCTRRSGPNKENFKSSPRQLRNNVHCLRGKSSSESELSCRSVSSGTKEENIYANDFPRREPSPPPPALPPKGPGLLKNGQSRIEKDQAPPVPPHRPRKLPQGMTDPASLYKYPKKNGQQSKCEVTTEPSDSYLLMGGFEKEEKQPTQDRDLETGFGREVVQLPTRKVVNKSDRQQQNTVSQQGAYMEMGSLFENENEFKARQGGSASTDVRPQYSRSYSASDVLDNDQQNSTNLNQSFNTSSNTSLIREENYLLMTNFKTQKRSDSVELAQRRPHQSIDLTADGSTLNLTKNIADTSFSSDTSDIDNTAIPFPNLMNFQQHTVTTTSTKPSRNSTCGPPNNTTSSVQTDKVNEGSSRNPGFLTRLIRRNSGNRKSMSQSQENLLASSSSESCLERTAYQSSKEPVQLRRVLSQSSDSSSSSCGHHHSPTLPLSDHRRSSSFPNRASFLEQKPANNDKVRGLHQGMQGNYFSALSLDDEMQLLECDNEFTGSDSSSLNDISKGGRSQSGYRGPCESTGSENGDDDCESLSDKQAQKLLLYSRHKKYKPHDSMVFTALQSDPLKILESTGSESSNSSKTDDEKLIELFKHGSKTSSFDDQHLYKVKSRCTSEYKKRRSLPTDGSKALSPKEEALAIVKHVSSLPPFVPPKLKHYPCPLSPVPESVPMVCNSENPLPSHGSVLTSASDTPKRSSVDPVFQKELARATLRIQPPPPLIEEDENVWVQRDSTNSQEVKPESAAVEDKFLALVVEVEEECDQDDTISMSSLDSSLPSCDEGGIRTSPASTLLRPRSGKEYKMVERRRPLNDSLSSSPAQTPQSPSGDTVFTFESCSQSQTSVYSRERESPNVPKFTRTDSSVSSRIHERFSPPRTYMNIDMTPPSSPLYSMSMPPELIEPQLNYAEIDLSHSSNTRASKKSRKASQKSLKSNTIEYALIDMEATVAIQRAGREHMQSREDSLRRSDKKLSLSNKEHKPSLSEFGHSDIGSIDNKDNLDRGQKESSDRSARESPERSVRASPERRDTLSSPEGPPCRSSPLPEDTPLPERRSSFTSSSSSDEEE